jgi:hypothetical protein
MNTNFIQTSDDVYCKFQNAIAYMSDGHMQKVCIAQNCPYLNGTAQGEGVECLWNGESDQLLVHVPEDMSAEDLYNMYNPTEGAKGGPGSGNYRHSGRPGQLGGSGASTAISTRKPLKIGQLVPSAAGAINAASVPSIKRAVGKILAHPKKQGDTFRRSALAGALSGANTGIMLGTILGGLGLKLKVGAQVVEEGPAATASYLLGGVAGTAITAAAGAAIGGSIGSMAGQVKALKAFVQGDKATQKLARKVTDARLKSELDALGSTTKACGKVMLKFALPDVLHRATMKVVWEVMKRHGKGQDWEDVVRQAKEYNEERNNPDQSDEARAQRARERAQRNYEAKQARTQTDHRKGKRSTERVMGKGGKPKMNADDIARAKTIATLKNKTTNKGEAEAARARLKAIMDKYDTSGVSKDILASWKEVDLLLDAEHEAKFTMETVLNVLDYMVAMIPAVVASAAAQGVDKVEVNAFIEASMGNIHNLVNAMETAFST